MRGIFTFAPAVFPEGYLFVVHFIMAFILLVCLPTHIFAAPFSVVNARQREDGLKLLTHEE
jgi:Ni,Fe-hydrogenase I cytochrome b subunit